jgi:CBS domain-containing protein
MKVSEWLKSHDSAIVTVSSGSPIDEVIARLLNQPCLRDVYVTADDGRLLGHISHKRLAEHLLAEHRPTHTRRQLMERVAGGAARDFMNSAFAVAAPGEELDDVLNRQLEMDIEDMPVVGEDGRTVGAVNLTAVLRNFMNASRESGETPEGS